MGHIDHESLAKENVYSWPVTGCKARVRERIYTVPHKPNPISELHCFEVLILYVHVVVHERKALKKHYSDNRGRHCLLLLHHKQMHDKKHASDSLHVYTYLADSCMCTAI